MYLKIIFVALLMFLSGMAQGSAVLLSDVETAILKQDYPLAEELSQDILGQKAETAVHRKAQYYLGLSRLRQRQYSEARENFEPLTEQRSDIQLRDRAYLGIFDSYFLQGEYKEAAGIAGKLLRRSRHSDFLSLIYLKLAKVNLKLAKWADASKYLNKIIEEFPAGMEVYAAKQLLNEKEYFSVQVGSFLDRKRAEELAAELNQRSEYAYIIETADQQNIKYYRVRVGQLASLEEAESLKLELAKKGYPTQIYP